MLFGRFPVLIHHQESRPLSGIISYYTNSLYLSIVHDTGHKAATKYTFDIWQGLNSSNLRPMLGSPH